MSDITLSTKEIRSDLEGFLKRIKRGQTIKVLHRSKELVTLTAKDEDDSMLAKDAGTRAAALRSIVLARKLSNSKPKLDPNKSIKELYRETQKLWFS